MSAIAIPVLSRIPFLGPIVFTQTVLAYLALIAIVAVWFLLYRTKWGLHVRAVGEHPEAADTVGLTVRAIRWQAVVGGAALAGLGGAFYTIGTTGAFNKDMTSGDGFIALAALIMGRWKPGLAAVMALFFGFVRAMGVQFGSIQSPINPNLISMLPYLATVIAVTGLIGKVRSPKADGVPYVK
jgi:simple sugar transport system permease protein